MEEDILDFNKGDIVLIESGIYKKQIFGRIESIQPLTNTFEYIHYYTPEETHCGRMDHHSKKELFKTFALEKDNLNSIIKKISVLYIKQYLEKIQSETNLDNIYLSRQDYDTRTHCFLPEELKNCFCDKIVNPDEDFILCVCDKLYHDFCVPEESITCNLCGAILRNDVFISNSKKRKRPDEFIPLKRPGTGYNLNNAKTYLIQQKTQNKTILPTMNSNGNKLNRNVIIEKPSSKMNIEQRKIFTKINESKYQKLMNIIEKYKQINNLKSLKGVDRSRGSAKENIFSNLMYGIFELQEEFEKYPDNLSLQEKKFIFANEIQDIVKRLVIEIETVIFCKLNLNNQFKLMPEYVNKIRVIVANLKDENNLELRRKILTGILTAELLVEVDEKELTNTEKRKERLEKEQSYLKAHIIDNTDNIIAKTHKGEFFLERTEENKKLAIDGNEVSESAFEPELSEHNSTLIKTKSESQINNMEEEFNEGQVNSYKIRKTLSTNPDSAQKETFNQKNEINLNKFIDKEIWKTLQTFTNGKKINSLADRIRKNVPEKEAVVLIEKLMKFD